MPRLHPCTVGCRIKLATDYLQKQFYRLDIILVLLIEIASMFMNMNENYMLYRFPMMMYGIVYILLRTVISDSKKLKYCIRKRLAYNVLSYYFLFGMFSVLFQIGNDIYSIVISNSLLILSSVLVAISIYGNKK